MKNIIFVLLFFCSCNHSIGQEWTMGIGYSYLFSKQWDKAIQTYNFGRPFISEKQQLLQNGAYSSIAHLFKSKTHWGHGLGVSYQYYGSKTINDNFNTVLKLHFFNFNYFLHFESTNGLFFDLGFSAILGVLFRNINDESFIFDETRAYALGVGESVSFNTGYKIKLNTKLMLSPFLGASYAPYYYSPKTESIINQTQGLTGKNWSGLYHVNAGIIFFLVYN